MPNKIDIPGFHGQYVHEIDFGRFNKIYFPVTGHLVMLRDDPRSMKLYDDYVRAFHEMSHTSFLWGVNNQLEGRKKFPRPFIYEESDGKLQLISQGDKVMISYVEGNWHKPLITGSIESLGIVNQKKFLRLDGDNLDRQPERYENEYYIYEFENDGRGNLNLKVEAKEEGEGNINIELLGVEGQGQVKIVSTGGYSFKRVKDGEEIQHIELLDSGEVKVMSERTKTSENLAYGDTLKKKLEELIDTINQITVPTPAGVSGVPNNAAVFTQIKSKLGEILTDS